ncbi:right-handed parallel beta-helix repeat-containing protein [Pseudoxanthomonas sp. 22568]|uniref:right-handed parallel beta-helix repeat-containing protein n=1 Tax=Pseudoxanthomonas sp. 22568 TaxID=3453945 RepID=UPI003F85A618
MSDYIRNLPQTINPSNTSLAGDQGGRDVRVVVGAPGGVPGLDENGNMDPRHLRDEGVINVKVYGARGDGQTDDTAAIQQALDELHQRGGGSLFFPAGTYMIKPVETSHLWVTLSSNRRNYAGLLVPSNVRIFGVGSRSEIKLIDTLPSPGTTDGRGDFATTHMMVNRGAIGLPKTVVDRNIVVHDLKFNGNLVEQSGEGVSFCGVEGFLIQNCEFTGSYYETNYFVFSRGGEFINNRCYANGIYQIDGGGPMVDGSSHITVSGNVITDSGYYAILLIDSWNVACRNNKIYPGTYAHSAGYQAIRVAGCSLSEISGNTIVDSGYSAIWLHNGHTNIVADNAIVHAGYAAGGGSNIHGITADYTAGNKGGRHIIRGNRVMDSFGAGIAVLEAFPANSSVQENAGCIIEGNTCAFNGRDGIAVIGKFHRINGNTCESNGLTVTDGVPGNGYNGIALNGARWCIVEGNTCTDIPQAGSVPLNMDAKNGTEVNPPRLINHGGRTQNYGIVEYPADTREEAPTTVTRSGTTVTVTRAGHTVQTGQLIHCYNGAPNDYNGYFSPTVVDANTFTYQMVGNPNTIASIVASGGKMVLTTNDPLWLEVGEVWNCFISNGDAAGDWYAIVTGTHTARLENMPTSLGVAGSTACNFCQFGGGDTPDAPFVYAAESYAADNNIIRHNMLAQNLANPVLGNGPGYKAYVRGVMVCGANSQVANNLSHP